MKAVTIEFDHENRNSYFAPLDRVLRGRFDFARCNEPMARLEGAKWPAVPGQRLTLIPTSKAATIHEPLRDEEFAALREQIERKGQTVPQHETLKDVDVCTFVHFMRQAVESGNARIVDGELPNVEGNPRLNFIVDERPDNTRQLADVLAKLTAVLDRLAK